MDSDDLHGLGLLLGAAVISIGLTWLSADERNARETFMTTCMQQHDEVECAKDWKRPIIKRKL